MDFFERASYPPDLPPGQAVTVPRRPMNMMGTPVAIDLLLARSATAAVMHGLAGLRGKPGDEYGVLSDEHLRFGIEFADGRKATNVGPPMCSVAVGTEGPMLHPGGGGAGESMAQTTYWAWPLPPPGPLAFVCEWPKYGVRLTRREIDSELLLTAATQAIELWPEEPEGGVH